MYNKTWDVLDTDSHQITDVGITIHSTTDQELVPPSNAISSYLDARKWNPYNISGTLWVGCMNCESKERRQAGEQSDQGKDCV